MPRVYIGLGSNIEPAAHLAAALDRLSIIGAELLLSPVYESEAIGFSGAPFLNMVAGMEIEQPLVELLALLRQIECDNGYRGGAPKFSSRSLDLDVLVYGDLCGRYAGVELPRMDITAYAYALWPLADIAGSELHPQRGISYATLRQQFQPRQQLRRVPFIWQGRDLSADAHSCAS